jgi:hypothetical protein
MFRQNMSTYVLQNILWHLDTDEIVTDLMDAVSLVANVSQKMINRRRESIKQDIGEKYTELWSRQTPITGKLFGMSCLVLTMADSLMSSSTESTGCSYEWLSGCIVNGTSMSGCCTVSGTAIAGYGMGSGTSMPGCCMVNGTSIPGCCIVNGMSMAGCCMDNSQGSTYRNYTTARYRRTVNNINGQPCIDVPLTIQSDSQASTYR